MVKCVRHDHSSLNGSITASLQREHTSLILYIGPFAENLRYSEKKKLPTLFTLCRQLLDSSLPARFFGREMRDCPSLTRAECPLAGAFGMEFRVDALILALEEDLALIRIEWF